MKIITTLVFGCLVAAGQAAPPNAPSPDEIAQQIQRLGADKLVDREDAMRRLWGAGLAAESALKKAAESSDAEVRFRARSILERFQYGILPQTSEETIALVRRFRAGDPQSRQEVLKMLSKRNEFDTMLALMRSETDENLRRNWFQMFLQDPTGIVGQLAQEGKWDEVERLLEAARSTPEGVLVWAAFVSARGELDARIARLTQQAQQAPAADAPTVNLWLAYLLRVKGDLIAARAAAELAGDKPLQRALAVEAADWAAAAKLHDQGVVDLPVPLPNSRGMAVPFRQIELLGYSAAFQRRAGRDAEFRAQLVAIEKMAEDNAKNTSLVWNCVEALLINDQTDRALVLMKSGNPVARFDLLAYLHRYQDAFEMVGWKPGVELNDAWFDALPAVAPNAGTARQNRFRIATYLSRVIHNLGYKDEAARLVQFLTEVVSKTEPAKHQTSADPMWLQLAYTEIRMGMVEVGYEHAGRLIANDQFHLMRNFFGSRATEAEAWYRLFRAQAPKEAPGKLLQRVDAALAWSREASLDTSDLEAVVGAIDQTLKPNFDEALQVTIRLGIASTCLVRQRPELARKLVEPFAEKHVTAKLKLADALLAEKEWRRASALYEESWQAERQQVVALWLSGHCAVAAGDRELGEKRLELADALALTGVARHALASGIAARGLNKEAVPHWERLIRTGAFELHETNDGARLLADAIQSTDPGRAAQLWERHMLANLRGYFYFLEFESYVRFPAAIHKAYAQAAALTGDAERVRREMDLAFKASPNDVRTAEHLVPVLEKANLKAEADAIFQRTFEHFEPILREFPNSAEHQNNLAWVAARCHRRLDDALRMAQKAVELAPRQAMYIDTLAEVHFHRGDRDEAVKLSQRCTELAPRDPAFRRQLARFHTAPIPTGPVAPLNDDSALVD